MLPIEFMHRTLQLAEKGSGYTSPNPNVGAVLVKDGRVIGEGYHSRHGEGHAEVVAIQNSPEAVRGADLYCNLEPCCHDIPSKRTPPCTQRIIQEGIGRIYISTIDPNPHVNGNGIARLQEAGIPVTAGLLAGEARRLNEVYFRFIQSRLPFVHLKMAMSLDGRIATASGDARWISDESARRRVHAWRHKYDAVMVGRNTVVADDPQLTVRFIDGRQPHRIVIDSRLALTPGHRLFQDEHRSLTMVFTTVAYDGQRRRELERLGVQVIVVGSDSRGRVAIGEVLTHLAVHGITSVLVEGGGAVATEIIREGLFDKLSFFIAPLILGKGVDAIGDLGIDQVAHALRLQEVSQEMLGDQVLVEGYRNISETFGILAREESCLPAS